MEGKNSLFMMCKNFLHNVKSFHIIFIYTCLSLLLLPVFVRYTCPKQVIDSELFQASGFCLLRTSMHLLMWMVNISSVLLETGAFSFLLLQFLCLGFFRCFVYFSGFSFVSQLRLSMKNKKYKQRKEIYDLMQSRYIRFLLHFPLSCNCP